jgi:poly(3-hydroxybutyrate) depolymerase
MDMYTPLHYLMKTRDGCGKSTVAKYWRIRSGIEQANTALTTEVNLALALAQCDGVKNVDFETVWEQDHTEAERTGDSTENFVAWINACLMTES